MKQIVQQLIKKSGKNTTVDFSGKDRRVKFDENFGKDKLDLIDTALGDESNKSLIFQKISN